MAHYTVLQYTNPSGSFYLSQRKVSGPASMGGHHFHTNYEIFYLLSGERMYFIKDRTFHVKKGDLIFIKPFDLHTTQDTAQLDHERILIKINKDFVVNESNPVLNSFDILFEQHNFVSFNPLIQNEIDQIFDQMLLEIKNQATDFESSLHSLLLQLLILSARNVQQDPSSEQAHISPTHSRILEIVKYINQHYQENLTLSSIADHFYISGYYLSRNFKDITGFTFVEYLNNLRVTHSQKLLRDSKLSVVSISDQVGFGNRSHFSRTFKSITGLSPLQYRILSDDPSQPTTFKKGKKHI